MPRGSYGDFVRELEKLDRQAARTFMDAVRGMTDTAQVAALDRAIADRDFSAVFSILRMDDAQWAFYRRQIEQAFVQGAIWGQAQAPKRNPAGIELRIGFDHRNPRAEGWYVQRGAQFVTEMLDDQRAMVRTVILEGLEQGRGVTALRKDLIGTRVGGQRKGGVVGLHSRDVEAVRRAREELGDPATLRAYMQRSAGVGRKLAPNGRTVASAIKAGRALTADEIEKTVKSYANKLLRDRSDRIARTEMHNAFSSGQAQGMAQMMERNNIPADAVTKTWKATVASLRTRDTHRAMNNQAVPFDRPFQSPRGAQLMHPGDSSLGAGAEETINCRCSAVYRVAWERLAV